MTASVTTCGRLAIVGGRLQPDNAAICEAMKRLCNGRMAVIPLASEIPLEIGAEAVDSFRDNGIETELVPLLWDEPRSAFADNVVDLIRSYGSVFFAGGDQNKVVRSLVRDGVDTPALRAIRELQRGGGLVAGSSAGAAVMSAHMILGGTSNEALSFGLVDDPDIPGLALGSGLGFFPWGVIDQHFLARGRIGRLVVAVNEAGERFGFGIDENTALMVEGDRAVVRGETGVVVVDLRNVEFGEDNSIQNVRISYVDDGDEYDFKRHRVIPHKDKKTIRVTRSSFKQPAPVKRCAFGIYTLHDLMLRLAQADPAHYLRDSVSSWPDKGDVEWCVELERVPRRSRALSAIRRGEARYTVVNFLLRIHRGDSGAVARPPLAVHAHHPDQPPSSQLVLLGNSPLSWRESSVDMVRPYLKEPVGVLAAASARPRQVAFEYIQWLRDLDITAEELPVDANNIARRNRDSRFLRSLRRMGTILFVGGNQRRLTQTLTYRGDVTAVLRELVDAFDAGTNLIGVGGAAAAMGQPMIAEGDSFEALRFGASEDAGSEGMVMEPGLGLFEAGIVDQNFVRRGRLGRLLVACAEEQVEYGFGLCEESGLVVSEDKKVLSAIGRNGFVVVAMNPADLRIASTSFSAQGVELRLVQPGDVFDLAGGVAFDTQIDTGVALIEKMVFQLADDCNGMFRSRNGKGKEGWLDVAFTQGPPSTLDIHSQRVRY